MWCRGNCSSPNVCGRIQLPVLRYCAMLPAFGSPHRARRAQYSLSFMSFRTISPQIEPIGRQAKGTGQAGVRLIAVNFRHSPPMLGQDLVQISAWSLTYTRVQPGERRSGS